MFNKKFLIDASERIVVTFVQGFLIAWLVAENANLEDLFSGQSLQGGLLGGVLAAAKAIIAYNVGSSNTAALLPDRPDTDQG